MLSVNVKRTALGTIGDDLRCGRRPPRFSAKGAASRKLGDGDLNPENRGRRDPALSGADAKRTVRAGGAFSRAAFLMGFWRVTIARGSISRSRTSILPGCRLVENHYVPLQTA
jgi:hypothetical protein